ncbi:MAG: LysR family transcriptional regulator [Pigmentiphaga sp.]|nr:LysR family transcriptional regulator [Pigmentiphaga sp.]
MTLLKPQQLRYFAALASHGSIRAAARALNVSQASVTQGLRELEEDVGLALILRGNQGAGLTEAGRQLLPHAQAILEQMRRAGTELERLRQRPAPHRLAIGVTPWIASTLLPHALNALRAEVPDIQLEIAEGLSATGHPRLREGSLDVLLARTAPLELPTDLQARPLFAYDLVVTTRQGHPLADAQHLAQLDGAEWLLNYTPQEAPALFHQLFGQHGLATPHMRIHLVYSFSLMLALLQHTDMLSFCPWPLVEALGRPNNLAPVMLRESFLPHTVSIIQRRGNRLPWVAERFVAHLIEQIHRAGQTGDARLRRVMQSVEVLV